MKASIFTGRNAHNSNPNQESTMTSNTLINRVTMTLVMAIFNTACGDDLTGNVADTTIGLEVRGSALCMNDPRPDGAFCPTEFEIPAVLPTGYASSGEQSSEDQVIKVTIDSGTNVGLTTIDLPSDMLDGEDNGKIHLVTADLDLPTGYRLQKCGAEGDASTIDIVAGMACLSIVYTGDDTGGPGTGNNGSGKGNVGISAEDEDGNPLEGCSFNFNSDQLDDGCVVNNAGATCNDVAKGNYTVSVSCEDGSLVATNFGFAVIEDMDTAYTVEVVAPPSDPGNGTTGSFDVSVGDSMGNDLPDCVFDFVQLDVDPASMDVANECEAAEGCYRFVDIKAKIHHLMVTCGSLKGHRAVPVVAGEHQHIWMVLLGNVPDGDLCVGKLGLPIDLDTPTASIQQWVGYGANGACEKATDAQYAAMTVIDLSGPDCADLMDAGCSVSPMGGANDPLINGEYAHLLWTADFSSYDDVEQRIFAVTVQDENMNEVVVHLDTLNGYFQ